MTYLKHCTENLEKFGIQWDNFRDLLKHKDIWFFFNVDLRLYLQFSIDLIKYTTVNWFQTFPKSQYAKEPLAFGKNALLDLEFVYFCFKRHCTQNTEDRG